MVEESDLVKLFDSNIHFPLLLDRARAILWSKGRRSLDPDSRGLFQTIELRSGIIEQLNY